MYKRTLGSVMVLFLCFALFGCSLHEGEPAHKSKEELEIGYFYYEGIFLSTEEVTEAFRSVSDEFPRYPIVPKPFHITTEYMPETVHDGCQIHEVHGFFRC